LEPYPGRARGTLQDTLSLILALVFAETLRVPGIGLALALILLLQRGSPGITFRNILQIFGGAVAACIACLIWVQFTDGTEVFRFLGFVLGVFLAGFCMVGTRLPLFFTIFGFYGFVDLAGWDAHRSPDATVRTMLSNVASLAIALGTAGLVNFLSGSRHPAEELRDELHRRLRTLASFHRELATSPGRVGMTALHHDVVQYANSGSLKLNELYEELRSANPKKLAPGIRFRIGLLTDVLERSSLLGFVGSSSSEASLRIADLCDHLLDPRLHRPANVETRAATPLKEIFAELSRYDEAEREGQVEIEQWATQPTSFRLFHSDAFTSPHTALYALKLTLCASVCYVFYNAIAWPGILTCVVTVLFTGLSSTGAMKQKQLYRLIGAAIGGGIALLVESLLFPNMDSITALVLVAGAVCMISAWISRSPHIGYVGVQIAFAFFLTSLAGFGPANVIAPARDRVIGIGLGVSVMWFVFDQLWPKRPSDLLHAILERMLRNAHAHRNADPSAIAAVRAEVSSDLALMQILVHSAQFDFRVDQHRELARSRRLTRDITAAAGRFYRDLPR
jgi:multidrug resistance protein MdtO